MTIGRGKSSKKKYKTWKIIRPRNIMNCHQYKKQLDWNKSLKSNILSIN